MSANFSYLKLVTFGLILASTSLAQADEQSVQLAYRFQAGQFLHFEMADQAEMLTQFGGTQSKSLQQTQMRKAIRVVAVDEKGGATIEPFVEIVRMSSQSGDRPAISFDSSTDQTPPKEFEKIAGTIGRPLARFQVAANGKLLKVIMLSTEVPKNLTEAAEKTDPSLNCLVVFPEKPVKVGEKWTEKYETSLSAGNGLNRNVTMIRSFELVKSANGIATIQFRTSLLTPTNDPEVMRQLVQLTPAGTIEFDLQRGQIQTRSLKIDEKVVEAFGPQSLLQAKGESVERLMPAQVANSSSKSSAK